jgi:hypothetical protein
LLLLLLLLEYHLRAVPLVYLLAGLTLATLPFVFDVLAGFYLARATYKLLDL